MSKADQLGTGSSFGNARPVSARRAAIAAATSAPTLGAGAPTTLPTELISHNPDNPREQIGDVTSLADTIREIGLIQAITVATVDAYLDSHPDRAGELNPGAQYVVVDGHRRHAAAQQAGLTAIKATIDDALVSSDEGLLEAAFVANTQRENMSDLEEAQALEKLVGFYGSQGKAAKRLGVTQAYISQRLSLLALTPELQADLEAGVRKVEHVRGLAKLSPQEQKAKADERAEQARLAAEERQKKKQEGQRRVTAASSGPGTQASGHNAVMTSRPEPQAAPTHNAVMTRQEDRAGGLSPAPGPAVTAPPTSAAAQVPHQDAQRPTGNGNEEMPWDSPKSVLAIASQRMEAARFEELLELAAVMAAERQHDQ